MDIIRKIRKRIKTAEMLNCRHIEEVQITREEAEILGDKIKEIDGVRLVIVEKLGDMSKIDCFAYIERKSNKSCYCLDSLYCENKQCNFYRNDITVREIEKDIEAYSIKK